MIQINNLTKAYGDRTLLADVTWNVSDQDRVGLCGPNGSGKTTLLRLLARQETADDGKVTTPRGTTVGYLPQDGLRHDGRSLRDEALEAFRDVLAIGDELKELEAKMEELSPESAEHATAMTRYGECREAWDRHSGFTIESRTEEVLLGLGFRMHELDAPTKSFSGGWQMRIALAKLLLEQPSLLLLDEPTNHLDLEARNWLEDFLAAYPHAIVLVSHDRYFLDRVVTRITEIDRRRLVDYSGSYTHYLETRQKAIEELRARARRQQEEIERNKRFINRFRAKASKAKQVQSRIKALEKIEVIEAPPERKLMKLRLPEPERPGRVVIEMKDVRKHYGDNHVFDNAELIVERGERLALVGPNGVGKSTLMRLLSGVEPPDAGEIRLGHKVSTGYFSQERHDLDDTKTVLENMTEGAPIEMIPRLRSILGAFLFHGDDVDKKVKVLSGGEKSRLALARMLLQPANVLLLDEPTNHLDLDSKEILLDALREYRGTIIFVSHDRFFLDELAMKVVEVGDGGVRVHWGGYPDFLRAQEEGDGFVSKEGASELSTSTTLDEIVATSDPQKAGSEVLSKNETRQIQARLEELEVSIEETEIGIDSLEGRMSVPGFYDDARASSEVVETHAKLKEKLEALYEEWEELSQKAPAAS